MPLEEFLQKSLSVDNLRANPEKYAKEAWETIVLLALNVDEKSFTFKGGSCLRLLYGSPRMSSDLDFDENPDGRESSPDVTANKITKRLEEASLALRDFGFVDVSSRIVKKGEGTVRIKIAAAAPLKKNLLEFVSKIEVSRRTNPGLDAIATKYGIDSVVTEMQLSRNPSLHSEMKDLKSAQATFIKTYTPMAIFLMKLSAIASPNRASTRDVYDLAYIWKNLGLGNEPRRDFARDCISIYMEHGMTPAEKGAFGELLREKASRFADDFDKGTDIHFSRPVDSTEVGLFVMDFADEFLGWKAKNIDSEQLCR